MRKKIPLIGGIINLIESLKGDIGIIENTDVATHSISAGSYVIWHNELYKASSAIAVDDALSSSNLTAVSGGAANELNNNITKIGEITFTNVAQNVPPNGNISLSDTSDIGSLHIIVDDRYTTGDHYIDEVYASSLSLAISGKQRRSINCARFHDSYIDFEINNSNMSVSLPAVNTAVTSTYPIKVTVYKSKNI